MQHYGSENAPCFGVPSCGSARQPDITDEIVTAAARWDSAACAFHGIKPDPNTHNFAAALHEALTSRRTTSDQRFVPLCAAPEQLRAMEKYCKALITIAGIGRRAQDFVAGWISTLTGNSQLVQIPFQYEANPADVDAFLVGLDQNEDLPDESKAMILRCFIFDCMTLLARTSHHDQSEQVRRQIEEFAQRIAISPNFLVEAEEIAKEELALSTDKFNALDEDDSTTTASAYVSGHSTNLNSDDAATFWA